MMGRIDLIAFLMAWVGDRPRVGPVRVSHRDRDLHARSLGWHWPIEFAAPVVAGASPGWRDVAPLERSGRRG